MKLLNATITVIALAAGSAFAGTMGSIYDKGKEIVDPRCPCFFEGLQVGVYASGLWGPDSLGNQYDPDRAGDDALGAGVSLAYYFTERVALEYGYAWHSTFSDRHAHTLDLLYRVPIGNSCFAPYILGGGGVNTNGTSLGVYRLGAGLEYRLPNCVGLFADYTHSWIAGGDEGWANDFNLGRVGFRIPF